jgi:hypothetical protein
MWMIGFVLSFARSEMLAFTHVPPAPQPRNEPLLMSRKSTAAGFLTNIRSAADGERRRGAP